MHLDLTFRLAAKIEAGDPGETDNDLGPKYQLVFVHPDGAQQLRIDVNDRSVFDHYRPGRLYHFEYVGGENA